MVSKHLIILTSLSIFLSLGLFYYKQGDLRCFALHPLLWGLNPLQQVASLIRIYGSVLLVQCKQTKFYGANTERSWSLQFDCTMTGKHLHLSCGTYEMFVEIPYFSKQVEFDVQCIIPWSNLCTFNYIMSWKRMLSIYTCLSYHLDYEDVLQKKVKISDCWLISTQLKYGTLHTILVAL